MARINQRLDGLNPLAYIGVNAFQPTDFITRPVDPTTSDSRNFFLGTWWLNTATMDLFYLASLAGGIATWLSIGNGTMETLTGDIGGPVSPDANGNTNLLGTPGRITTTGNPATNTITWDVSGEIASQYTTDSGIAVPIANNLNVFGAHGINTSGATDTVTIAIDNAITLGDLAVIAPTSPALTAASGSIFLGGSTVSAATNPKIIFTSNNNLISFLFNNVFIGSSAGNDTMTAGQAIFNIGIGPLALNSVTIGTQNTAIGNGSLSSCTTGQNNHLMGYVSGLNITTGSSNCGIGSNLFHNGLGNGLITGSFNVGLGSGAGSNFTGAESSNILINNLGVVSDSNVMRIGAGTGAGSQQLNKSFISGIRGITTDVNDAVAVLIDSAGQLGTTSSSIRYKENVETMTDYSDPIMELRPVTFNYKHHDTCKLSVGLIAEEVSEVFPELVVYNNESLPETVKYHDLVPMLLNEVQKLYKRVSDLEDKLKEM